MYVLDKSAHIVLEKILTKNIFSIEEKDKISTFLNKNVFTETSKGIFFELVDSYFASYTSVGTKTENTGIPLFESKPNLSFRYKVEKIDNCKDLFLQSGRVGSNDITLIVKCIKDGNGNVVVTQDNPMMKLCNSLGVEAINFDKFVEVIDLKKTLIFKVINLIKNYESTKPTNSNPN